MDKEYIDRDAAVETFKANCVGCESYGGELCTGCPLYNALLQLDMIPVADVDPVVHGYWINTPPYRAVNGSYKKGQECSVCNAYYVSDGNTPYSNHPYCAECGAKMDGAVQR